MTAPPTACRSLWDHLEVGISESESPWPADRRRASKRALLASLDPVTINAKELAGEPIVARLTGYPGNDESIGGIKVVARNGRFAGQPSGTEDGFKICAEGFHNEDRLKQIQTDAQALIGRLFEKT